MRLPPKQAETIELTESQVHRATVALAVFYAKRQALLEGTPLAEVQADTWTVAIHPILESTPDLEQP